MNVDGVIGGLDIMKQFLIGKHVNGWTAIDEDPKVGDCWVLKETFGWMTIIKRTDCVWFDNLFISIVIIATTSKSGSSITAPVAMATAATMTTTSMSTMTTTSGSICVLNKSQEAMVLYMGASMGHRGMIVDQHVIGTGGVIGIDILAMSVGVN
jgi:hypothetical protein